MQVALVDMTGETVAEDFGRAIHDTGFAVLRNAPISAERLTRMSADWLSFFLDGPKWDYLAVEMPSGNTSGYIPPDISETAVGHTIKDLKEFFHVHPATVLPAALDGDTRAHMADTFTLAKTLLAWLDQHCKAALTPPLRGKLADSLCVDASLLRVLHYPPLEGDEPENAVRAAAHEDINLITLLPVSQQSGLQVRTRDGQWQDVPGKPGDIVVNAGDMLQEATGGYLPSTTHRVVNPAAPEDNCSRIAIPYFMAPALDIRLSNRYTAGSYLKERLDLLAR